MLSFEFDPAKAAANLKKHGVSFSEGMTVFYDPLAQTFPDELHSEDEDRFITLSISSRHRLLFVSHLETENLIRLIGVRRATHAEKKPMKNSRSARKPAVEADPLEPRHLDLSNAVRGKYYGRVQQAANVVVIAPDLLDTFPDSESVNEALRGLKKIAIRSVPRARKAASAGR